MLGEKLAPWNQVLRALGGLLEGEQRAARTGLIGVRMGRPLGNIIYIMRNVVSGESGPLLAPHGNGWASRAAPAKVITPLHVLALLL